MLLQSNLTIPPNVTLNFGSGGTVLFQQNGRKLTVNGNLSLNCNLSIPTGDTLSLFAAPYFGAPAICLCGTSITVSGTLLAQGSSGSNVAFDRTVPAATWGTITFIGGGSRNSLLNYVTVAHGAGIQCTLAADVTIANSQITGCTNGIYIYDSNPVIHDNTILNTTGHGIYGSGSTYYHANIYNNKLIKESGTTGYGSGTGIYLGNGMSIYAAHNDIRWFSKGMYFGGGSNASFILSDNFYLNPNNRIRNCDTALAVAWSAYCDAGEEEHSRSFNSIYGNTLALKAYQNGGIWADFDYWGSQITPTMSCDGTSWIDYEDCVLSTDPWAGVNSVVTENTPKAMTLQKKGVGKTSDFKHALQLEQQGKITDAVTLYKNMISYDNFAEQSMSRLVNLKSAGKISDNLDFLTSAELAKSKHRSHIRKLLAAIQLKDGNHLQALSLFDNIITDASNDHEIYDALFNKFFILLHYASDTSSAAGVLDYLKKQPLSNVDNELVDRLAVAQSLLVNSMSGKTVSSHKVSEAAKIIVPASYGLSNNFPNPFNPTTTINYAIPLPGMVTLKVYDALGCEVRTLVNEEKAAGEYSVSFAADNLPSGFYLYTIRSGNFFSSKKMLLLK